MSRDPWWVNPNPFWQPPATTKDDLEIYLVVLGLVVTACLLTAWMKGFL